MTIFVQVITISWTILMTFSSDIFPQLLLPSINYATNKSQDHFGIVNQKILFLCLKYFRGIYLQLEKDINAYFGTHRSIWSGDAYLFHIILCLTHLYWLLSSQRQAGLQLVLRSPHAHSFPRATALAVPSVLDDLSVLTTTRSYIII